MLGRQATRRIAMVAFDDAVLLNMAGPAEVFGYANREFARRGGFEDAPAPYEVRAYSPAGGVITTSCGITLVTQALPEAVTGGFDTIAVIGGLHMRELATDGSIIAWLRTAAPLAKRIASFGSGAFLLGKAGLLDGRRCAAHWRIADVLAEEVPAARVEAGALFVRDGNCLTAAGSIASIDLALSMIEEDHGKSLALTVARVMVLPHMRPGDQPQVSAELRAQTAVSPRVQKAAEWILASLDRRPTVAAVARRFAMSERNFSRSFTREIGMSPQRFIVAARLEAARRWLTGSTLPIDTIARRAGYSSGEHLTHAFRRVMGTTPGDYRRSAREGGETF
jgi:transcriptional regulator GlxA family with amidase domain